MPIFCGKTTLDTNYFSKQSIFKHLKKMRVSVSIVEKGVHFMNNLVSFHFWHSQPSVLYSSSSYRVDHLNPSSYSTDRRIDNFNDFLVESARAIRLWRSSCGSISITKSFTLLTRHDCTSGCQSKLVN